jgi:LysW-gamma-L-lysine carboxypeptidase
MTDDFINLLETLVSIPSPSHNEAEAANYLAQWMREHGLQAFVDGVGNAVGGKGEGSQEIMLLGHIDTFPGQPPVRREGDLLYGRGSVDAKGALCVFAAAAAQVATPAGWRVTVVGAVEEEAASSRGARQILARRQYRPPAFCIIGEPSQWDRVALGYKGRLLLHLNARLPLAHSAGPEESPAEWGVKLWQAIQTYSDSFNQGRQGTFHKLNASLRAIHTWERGAYGEVELSLGFRLPLDLAPETLEKTLRDLVAVQAKAGEVSLRLEGCEAAYQALKSTPLVRAFLSAIRAAGGTPRFVLKTGTSDMNIVGPAWSCPILAYGPGDSSLDHTPQEHLNLREYLQAIEVLVGVLTRLME